MRPRRAFRLLFRVIFCLSLTVCASGQEGADLRAAATTNATTSGSSANGATSSAMRLPDIVVVSKRLDTSREQIVPSLGATKYTVNATNIDVQSQGDNASFDQTMLRFPGVVQDELDKRLHVRGEEANLQYRINDILLPDGLLGFGQELNTKFVDSLSLITGTLPAQYGGRTAGIVDIKTKSGTDQPGATASVYGGSYDTLNASLEYAGTHGNLAYYATSDYLHTSLGMANPTGSREPIHDDSDQYKDFAYLSYVLDSSSRINMLVSYALGNFEIPNTPGKAALYQDGSLTTFDLARLNENQTEQSFYEVLSYQKNFPDADIQLSQFSRASEVLFTPDVTGDLMFNGVASRVEHTLVANGIQGDARNDLNDGHVLRSGFSFTAEQAEVNTLNWVFPANSAGSQISDTPYDITDNSSKQAYQYSAYLQDEWALTEKLTLNYGLRFDGLNAYLNENQLSPRINAVYQATDSTTLHAGYARCFTPPPLYFVPENEIQRFNDTTHASEVTNSSPVKAERYHYFDAGLTQDIGHAFHLGLDAYYKLKKDVLDEGQFGSAMIFSPYNAERGRVYGAELTMSYELDGFSAYANISCSRAMAEGLTSGQFQFDPTELAYLETHWYHLDHDQRVTATAGVSYKFMATTVYADVISGTGMYTGFANMEDMPNYATANMGIKHDFMDGPDGKLSVRFDVVNVLDKVYEIRDGTGIGVFAPQYLPRRGFYGGVVYEI